MESFQAELASFKAVNSSVVARLDQVDSRLNSLNVSGKEVPADAGVRPPPPEAPQQASTSRPHAAKSPRSLLKRLKRKTASDDCTTPVKRRVRDDLHPRTPELSQDSYEEIKARFLSSDASRREEFLGFLFLSPNSPRRR